TEVRGMGRQRGITYTYRGSQYTTPLSHKVKVELVVNDEMVEDAVRAIQEAAGTGEVGDGKIFLVPVADAIRIRNGERGEPAIS
ncbi:MAG: P-II family nitrogen regulator, partial [Nitrospirae bacterium]|nr:P-II family nitrogen regulator [Fimbriimonadaceae bacterium]